MEQHPVPRNISSFQFHLIGDMTLRQFGYLASGVIIAYIIYRTSPLPQILTLPIVGIFGFLGVAFAFLPIQERPLDRWLLAFVRSIFSPTQYIWQKQNVPAKIFTEEAKTMVKKQAKKHIEAHQDAQEKLKKYLASLPTQPHETLNIREKKYIDQMLSLFGSIPQVVTYYTSYAQPSPSILKSSGYEKITTPVKPTPQASQPTISQKPPITVRPQETKVAQALPQARQKPQPFQPTKFKETPSLQELKTDTSFDENYQQKLKALVLEKEQLLKELNRLKEDMEKKQKPQVVKPVVEKEEEGEPTITAVSAKTAVDKVGLPNLPQTPNMVIGIVKDPQRKALPNIIITIKDKTNMPLRALKTNKLGQFVTATPLPNGTYYLEVEDPFKRYVFDIAEITLSGRVFLPIEIIAKGEKEIIRERLEKAIFSSASANI